MINIEYLTEFSFFDVFPVAYEGFLDFMTKLQEKYPQYKPNDQDNWYLKSTGEKLSYSDDTLTIEVGFYFHNQKHFKEEKKEHLLDKFFLKVKFDVSTSTITG